MFHDSLAVLRKELKALRLKAEQKRVLVQRYGPWAAFVVILLFPEGCRILSSVQRYGPWAAFVVIFLLSEGSRILSC